ncbi:hypothetical protein [Streptomyces griseoloalbus]|uniref:Uncharacterized protein n=1 Tax=Streptomyces griseoloalbus TaxID=67303 RepID=A0A7W8BPV3_9ACTN|nr:hypothetical protein [Streptomyces albaduncus]MBB5127401.1 hypothetical protein [Streptomyces albaduncus]
MPDTASSGDHTMFAYAFHHLRHDDLVRRAEHERQAREARRLRRAARREAAAGVTGPEGRTRRRHARAV